MSIAQDNETLTRVGPGTPMGRLMREYWLPAAKSTELVADGEPVRIMLLGEKLIGFRDSAGRVGVMDHRCPHRVASLFFGRNEEGGLRCVYHGWKFDVEGRCLDMPNVPKHQQFTETVHAKVYKVIEKVGVIWVYMGERAQPPAFPGIEAALLPDADVAANFMMRECNWLQALEGDIDTSHLGFLHGGHVDPEIFGKDEIHRFNFVDRAPEYHVADTDWGTMYAAYRPADPGQTYWRIAHFLFPCWSMPPNGDFGSHLIARAWVPMDDTHTMQIFIRWKGREANRAATRPGAISGTAQRQNNMVPNSTDWFGRFRHRVGADQDYGIDRSAYHTDVKERDFGKAYSGLDGSLQDTMVTESMGAITDHSFEHLAISDRMITRTRQRLLQAVQAHEAGIAPPGVDNPMSFAGARSGDFVAPDTVGWLEAYGDEIRAAANPTGLLKWQPAAE